MFLGDWTMDLDYFGSEQDVQALERQLTVANEALRPQRLAALAWYLRQRHTQRALALVDEALALLAAGALDAAGEAPRIRCLARLQLVHGEAKWLFAELDAAKGLLAQAREGFESIGDFAGAGDASLAQAILLQYHADEPVRANECFADALAAYQRAGDTVRLRCAEASLALGQFMQAPAAAVARWGELLVAAPASGHAGLDARIAVTNGWFAQFRGELVQEIAFNQRAFSLALAAGQLRTAIIVAGNVTRAFLSLNDPAQGLEWAERAVALARKTGWPATLTLSLGWVGLALHRTGRSPAARELLAESLAGLGAASRAGTFHTIAATLLGDVCFSLGEHAAAADAYAVSEDIERRAGRATWYLADALRGKSLVLSRFRRKREAIAAAEEAIAIHVKAGVRWRQAACLQALATIAREHQLPPPAGSSAATGAIHYLEQALAIDEDTAGKTVSDELCSELSREYEAVGDLARALAFERRAMAARSRIQSKKANDLTAAMQVRFETERAKADAEHNRALAEAEARRADAEAAANRAKSMFLASMSHELRSPLNAMLGFSRLLMRDASLGERARRDVGVVLSSGEHLYQVINQVLELSKIESGHMGVQPVSFNLPVVLHELEEVFALSARQKGLRLTVEARSPLPTHVEADVLKLRQVLVNLLGNAIKFTPHGSVTLAVRMVGDGRLRFSVTDTGVGIAAGELATLGEAFVQAQAGRQAAEGTGLGLALSRGFLQVMGGELHIESEHGRGTTAQFEIPVRVLEASTAGGAAAAPGRAVALAAGTPQQRILVVDDLADGRALLVRLLQPLGFAVREAANGREAVDLWQQWAPHLILMDMRMPVMDGREATRQVKARAREGEVTATGGTVVIALTASSFDEQREEFLGLGCDDFLGKPFKEEALLEMIGQHLGLRYEHEQLPAVPAEAVLDPQRLARIPPPLLAGLRSALDHGDPQSIEQALQQIRPGDADTADALAAMAARFEFKRIQSLLNGARPGQEHFP